jgi:hypothetical protein
MDRWDRQQFFARLASLDQDQLAKTLWTVYWKGTREMRQRIEAELDPETTRRRQAASAQTPDPEGTLDEVTEFVTLARAGAYMGGDRRVKPSERTRWRFEFRRLVKEAGTALADPDPGPGAEAMEHLLDLARETGRYDYFRSDDPIEAARIVVSDEVELLWARLRRHLDFQAFARRVAPQLLRWESGHGWTRSGFGRVAESERPLAAVLEPLLTASDSWVTFADRYLEALEGAAGSEAKVRQDAWNREHRRGERARDLALWHSMMLQHLLGGEGEDRMERLVASQAISGPKVLFIRARLALGRGEVAKARQMAGALIHKAPGQPEFLDLARELKVAPVDPSGS